MIAAIHEDAADGAKAEAADTEQFDRDAKLDFKSSRSKDLDEGAIVATAMVILLAGYDTTAITLSYVAYELARNPEVMKRCQVRMCVGDKGCTFIYTTL